MFQGLILCKDSANRTLNQQTCLIVMSKCNLSYAKIQQKTENEGRMMKNL